ncbi:MAG: hypothetical protein ACFE94_16265 [Candidatus Hodarchaeota archaeon]
MSPYVIDMSMVVLKVPMPYFRSISHRRNNMMVSSSSISCRYRGTRRLHNHQNPLMPAMR